MNLKMFIDLPVAFAVALPAPWEALLRASGTERHLVWSTSRLPQATFKGHPVPLWWSGELEALALAIECDALPTSPTDAFTVWCVKKLQAKGQPWRLTLMEAFGAAVGLRPFDEVREPGQGRSGRGKPAYRIVERCGRSLTPTLTVGELAARVGCEVVDVRCVPRDERELEHGALVSGGKSTGRRAA